MLILDRAIRWMARIGLGIVALTGGVFVAAIVETLGLPSWASTVLSCSGGACLAAALMAMVHASDRVCGAEEDEDGSC